MNETTKNKLDYVREVLTRAEKFQHAALVLEYDQETICPPKAMEEQGEIGAMLNNEAFKLIKEEAFIEAAEYLYDHRDELEEFDRVMVEQLHRDYLKTKNITPELDHEFGLIYNRAFVRWLQAKEKSDFSLFAPALKDVLDVEKKKVELQENEDGPDAAAVADAKDGTDAAAEAGAMTGEAVSYNKMLDNYERGMTVDALDECFGRCKERLIPLLKKITASGKTFRRDFLKRPVTDAQQAEIARYLLELIGFDFERGAFTTTEHPFTSGLGRFDTRVTTHYRDDWSSSMYSIIHEGGHALFDMFQPAENHDHFIIGGKTMGMHESVSRFYENRIGRSKPFVHLIYPKVCEVFPEAMADVSEEEFYAAQNIVTPSLIRTEADEFTYTFHIIIRYEIEKELIAGRISLDEVPDLWNSKYEEYLGVRPQTMSEGVLQDVHWTFGFGYFPTYALGNMYNAMYFNRMKQEIDVDRALENGDFRTVNDWMIANVFKKADRLTPQEWLRDITGRAFTPDDFLDYLEEKYGALYGLA